jgi:hypothetical protein
VKAYNKDWQLPPSLDVLPKGVLESAEQEASELPGATEEPIDHRRVVYLYYDFGKPFILRYEVPYGGGCGARDAHIVLTSIKKLSD